MVAVKGNKQRLNSFCNQTALFLQIFLDVMMSHQSEVGNSQLAHWNHKLLVFQRSDLEQFRHTTVSDMFVYLISFHIQWLGFR